jgi:hypothetical protein
MCIGRNVPEDGNDQAKNLRLSFGLFAMNNKPLQPGRPIKNLYRKLYRKHNLPTNWHEPFLVLTFTDMTVQI